MRKLIKQIRRQTQLVLLKKHHKPLLKSSVWKLELKRKPEVSFIVEKSREVPVAH